MTIVTTPCSHKFCAGRRLTADRSTKAKTNSNANANECGRESAAGGRKCKGAGGGATEVGVSGGRGIRGIEKDMTARIPRASAGGMN